MSVHDLFAANLVVGTKRQRKRAQMSLAAVLKQAAKAGVRVKVEVEPGKLAVTMIGDADVEAIENPWDKATDELQQRNN